MTKTQNKDWLYRRLIEERLHATSQCQDFLATCKGEYFGETDKYFFKTVNQYLFKEVRLFKKSKRVTTSRKETQI